MIALKSLEEATATVRQFDDGGGIFQISNYFGDVLSDEPVEQAFDVFITTPQYVLRPHFHNVDQYQVFVGGTGTFGPHDASLGTVHYTDRYSAYGPIVAGGEGIEFLTLRLRSTPETFFMPESRKQMEIRGGRNLSAVATPTDAGSRAKRTGSVLEQLIEDDDGLAASVVRLGPDCTHTITLDPETSGYWVVLSGSMHDEGRVYGERSVAYFENELEPYLVRAGSEGLDLLVMSFPRQTPAAQS